MTVSNSLYNLYIINITFIGIRLTKKLIVKFVTIIYMMNPQELISILKSQHTVLKSGLETAYGKADANDIILTLKKFRVDLIDHMKLENTEFYPDYMDKKIKRGESVEITREIIVQMNEIAKAIFIFLSKYGTAQSIDKNISSFKSELLDITGILRIRVDTEEEGIYGVYLLIS